MPDGSESQFCNCLFFTANALGRNISRLAEESFSPTGLSPSLAFIIMAANKNPGLTPSDLSEAMQLERSTVTRFVDTLENKGWLIRKADGRRMHLYPAKPAQAADKKIRKAWKNLYAAYAEILGQDSARKLTTDTYAAYNKLKQNKKKGN